MEWHSACCGRLIDVRNAAIVRYSIMIMQVSLQQVPLPLGIGMAFGMGSGVDMTNSSELWSRVVLVFPHRINFKSR